MKSKITLLVLAVFCLICVSMAQSPQKLTYQAVIRNTGGALHISAAVGMRVSFLQGSASGSVLYSEVYSPPPFTNANGLVTVEIGNGTPVVGTFSSINWANGPIFIKVESDPTGGTSYAISGTHQLLSVPYALYSSQAAALANGSFINPSQIAQDGALTNQVLKWNGTKWTPANDNINDGDTL
ncbi:MAG: collagen-like protein, partial [Bacteroidia bacterium]|nr:collagen-like protein [Bacteroidia bacterium]